MSLEHMSKYAHFLRGKQEKSRFYGIETTWQGVWKALGTIKQLQGIGSPVKSFTYFKNKTK